MASLLRESTLQSFRLFNLPIEQKWAPKGTQLKAELNHPKEGYGSPRQ